MPGLQSIDGLASSLDTTSIIDALINAERLPVVFMEDNQVRKTLEISNFKALSAKLLALKTNIGALNNRTGFSQATINVSNENILTASAEESLGTGTYSLNVKSLAMNHQIASQGFDDATQSNFGIGTISLSIGNGNPTIINISSDNNSLVDIKSAINDAKVGVTASIVNDGSSSKAFRLVLTGGETGANKEVSFSASLTGGDTLNFDTATFDDPETDNFSSLATSLVSLEATSSYTGAVNKSFTFTIADSGAQTVGSGNITLNWTDGTDSGSIVVSQADTEVIGPEGLKLSFADGDLVGGDTFTVSTFAPILQEAADAQVTIGSSDGAASPIIVKSSTNTVKDIIPGLTIDLKTVTTSESGPVTIKTGLDTSAIRGKINNFISSYNDVMEFIDLQNQYNSDTEEAGVLMGDITLQTIQSRLSGLVSYPIAGLDSSMNALSAIGIRTGFDGKLALKHSSKLTSALSNDFESVMNLFVDSGHSNSSGISFMTASTEINGGDEFEVDITQAATHGYFQGGNMINPANSNLQLSETNNKLKLRIDGIVSEEMVLSARTYASSSDLVNEIQTRIDNDEKIGNMGASVEWVDSGGGQGYIRIDSSSYGSASRVELSTSIGNSVFAEIGFATGINHAGKDVEGTINGESASGKGQVLTGDDRNSTTDGLKLKITLKEDQLVNGIDGLITITKGVASVLDEKLESITKSGNGIIDSKVSGLEKQVENIKDQIVSLDERLAIRRESLVLQFMEMEMALSQLQSESSFLTSQLEGISANLAKMTGKT